MRSLTLPIARTTVEIGALIIIIANVLHDALTPQAWDALCAQTHMPTHVGTLTLVTFLQNATPLLLMLLTAEFLLGAIRRIWGISNSAPSTDFSALRPLGAATLGSTRNTNILEDVKTGKVTENLETVVRDICDNHFPLSTLSEQKRADTVAKLSTQARSDGRKHPYMTAIQVWEALLDASQYPWTTLQFTGFSPLNNRAAISAVARLLNASAHFPENDDETLFLTWPYAQPPTAYDVIRLRLYFHAIPLLLCENAGTEADQLHENFAAVCRLASYKGYVVNNSNDPHVIEEITIRECQSVLAADVLATTPLLEAATA